MGTVEECRQASVVLPLIQRHHYLLVTLLLYNSAANETLPLFLDKLGRESKGGDEGHTSEELLTHSATPPPSDPPSPLTTTPSPLLRGGDPVRDPSPDLRGNLALGALQWPQPAQDRGPHGLLRLVSDSPDPPRRSGPEHSRFFPLICLSTRRNPPSPPHLHLVRPSRFLMLILSPISYPLAWLLDRCFGSHNPRKRYNRAELSALIEIHQVQYSPRCGVSPIAFPPPFPPSLLVFLLPARPRHVALTSIPSFPPPPPSSLPPLLRPIA